MYFFKKIKKKIIVFIFICFQFQDTYFPNLEPSSKDSKYKDKKFMMVFVKSYASTNPMEFLTHELHPDYAINVTYDIFSNFKCDKALMAIPKLFFFDVSMYPLTCIDKPGNTCKKYNKN